MSLFYVFLNEFRKADVTGSIFLATLSARICSGIIGYILNKRVVFKADNSENLLRVVKHFALTTLQMFLSASLLTYVDHIFHYRPVIEKMCVDTFLFVVFYFAQKFWVFKQDSH